MSLYSLETIKTTKSACWGSQSIIIEWNSSKETVVDIEKRQNTVNTSTFSENSSWDTRRRHEQRPIHGTIVKRDRDLHAKTESERFIRINMQIELHSEGNEETPWGVMRQLYQTDYWDEDESSWDADACWAEDLPL
jgi:hypothetical protein